MKFETWFAQRESSPTTRLKQNAALGLMPAMAPASVNSHSSGSPFQVFIAMRDDEEEHKKKKKKKKKD